jgi:H+-transporting ATPase
LRIAVAGSTDAAKSAADIVLTVPGLAIIIDAIRESRAIFPEDGELCSLPDSRKCQNFIFLTLCIVLLQFYPVTAIMIVVLAMINDLPIMMIAYDNVPVEAKPVRWQMRRIIILASLLGIIGVFSSFLLLWIAREWYHLDPGVIQTLVFLKTGGSRPPDHLSRTDRKTALLGTPSPCRLSVRHK